MTAETADVRLRLRSSSDVVEAVPFLVGFQPENSLVVLSLRGKRSRLGLTARVDLPPPDAVDECARAFVNYLERDKAVRALVVVYPPTGGAAHPVVRPLADALTVQLAHAGIEVADAICVSEGRWWSLLCANDGCCPRDGTPIDQTGTSICAATMAVAGRVVLESRTELERTLDPVTGMMHAAMSHALPAAMSALFDTLAAGRRGEAATKSIALFHDAVSARRLDQVDGGRPALTVDDAALLIAGLHNIAARDEILGWYDGDRGEATRSLLVELVRRAVPPFEVPPLTVLAWLAYLQGDGTFAGIALDRALAADPEYGLAQILDRALSGALDPEVFRRGVPRTLE
jgi:hypothetical protein